MKRIEDQYYDACQRCYKTRRRVDALRRRLNDRKPGDRVYDALMDAQSEYAIAEAAWFDIYCRMTGQSPKEVT